MVGINGCQWNLLQLFLLAREVIEQGQTYYCRFIGHQEGFLNLDDSCRKLFLLQMMINRRSTFTQISPTFSMSSECHYGSTLQSKRESKRIPRVPRAEDTIQEKSLGLIKSKRRSPKCFGLDQNI